MTAFIHFAEECQGPSTFESVPVVHSFLLPNNIPLYGDTTFYLSTHQLLDVWALLTFGCVSNAAMNTMYKFLSG